MKQSDPLQLVEEGSLDRPGPVGRIVRLALGMVCTYALYVLIIYRANIIATPVSALPDLTVMVLAALFIINYVVNIGFGKSFGRWPSYVSIAAMLLFATMSWLAFGTSRPLIRPISSGMARISQPGVAMAAASTNEAPRCR